MVEIFFPTERPPADDDILSLWQMMVSPDHPRWDRPDNPAYADKRPDQVLELFRATLLPRATHQACWARVEGQIVGRATLRRCVEEGQEHCGEIGFTVRTVYRGRGIGHRLVQTIVERAREMGLERLQCSCFDSNVAAIALLKKAGFHL